MVYLRVLRGLVSMKNSVLSSSLLLRPPFENTHIWTLGRDSGRRCSVLRDRGNE